MGHIEATSAFFAASVCLQETYQCADGQCIDMSLYCDYVEDCEDASDELNCGKIFQALGYILLSKTKKYFKVLL